VTSFAYATSWGATLVDGGARFRLWAPGEGQVRLVATKSDARIPMRQVDDGWFELATDAVAINDGYAFEIAGMTVPDPAARGQVADVHGPSQLVDPRAFSWRTGTWRGRPWEEAVIYELHTGTFSLSGTFEGVEEKLDHLASLGITAIELMPVAQFGGNRGWGYDGVLQYAPHIAYGGPEKLKSLIDAAHARKMMVLLDVVYNHFGPDGNYLGHYAPAFFHPERRTPWGAAIACEKPPVRRFFIENALYWLCEYRFDGLRLDAIDQIDDQAETPLLEELAAEVLHTIPERQIHLTTEDDRNIVRLHGRDFYGRPRLYAGEWNDDFHHAAHIVATGEREGYYADYSDDAADLARSLAEGYVYQGQASPYRDGAKRGEPCGSLPPTAFVDFLQNHDQIGNRAFGERLTTLAGAATVELLTAVLLLAPHTPLLFMGEEWGETRPFYYFTDFTGELADAVREGRRAEFKKWPQFADPANRERIPDPNAAQTATASLLDWSAAQSEAGVVRLALIRKLLGIRAREISPRLVGTKGGEASYEMLGPRAFSVTWRLGSGATLRLMANFAEACAVTGSNWGELRPIYESRAGLPAEIVAGRLPASSVLFALRERPQ
jgi:maltooligosyltrehalose trehalohydrolase